VETPGGKFLLRNEQEILVPVEPGVSEPVMRTHLLGPVMAALLRLRGLLVLHASSIAMDRGAVLFLGDSGAGKSTLAQAFCTRGHSLITDDVSAIAVDAQELTILPGYPHLRLWPVATMLEETGPTPSSHVRSAKEYHRLEGVVEQPLPLKGIYVLGGIGLHHSVRALSPQEAFLALVQFSRYALIPTRPELQKIHFLQCAQVANQVRVSYIIRQRSLNCLAHLVDLIKRDISIAIN
jgi:hypothetical protein